MDDSPTLPSLAFLNSPFLHHFSIEESRFISLSLPPSDEGLVAALPIPPVKQYDRVQHVDARRLWPKT
jgi:hypothetical protein